MENFPEIRFNRRRFLKSGLNHITRVGVSQAFSQTTWGGHEGAAQPRRLSARKADSAAPKPTRIPQIRLN